MKDITLSINSTYFCNFSCNFCYLTSDQLRDQKLLPLGILKERIKELEYYNYKIDHVDLYGGEIGLLPVSYLEELDQVLFVAGNPSINVVTNLFKINPYFTAEHVSLSVSFDFEAREKHLEVLNNILKINKEIAILMLASPVLIKKDVEEMISFFNRIQNIKSVEIKPYSTNQANQHQVNFKDFENFIKKWINSKNKKNFEFINQSLILNSINKTKNAYSDNHLYITPNGKFAVLDFDEQDHEFFLELSGLNEYDLWQQKEKLKIQSNNFCKNCNYLGHCLTEHYREPKDLDQSCNGFKDLLDWYQGHLLLSRHKLERRDFDLLQN